MNAGPRAATAGGGGPRGARMPGPMSGGGSSGDMPGPTSIGRASGIMALGTIASRATGFLRTVAIAYALGVGAVGNAYNVANVAPNIIYDLLLGGILTSVVVPVLVRAARDDPDGGVDFARSLLTLIAVTLSIAVVIGMLAAPLIITLYLNQGGAEHDLAVTFLRWFLPQVVFYGVGAAIGAILNIRGKFGAPMFTPVLNNLIVIATAVAFVLMSGGQHPTLAGITTAQTTVLAAGTTLGVVAMTVGLLPTLRRTGFRYRPRLNLRHPGLLQAGRLASWMFLYVLVTQLAYLFVIRLASGATAFPTYNYAFQLFQLPYAIVAVSVITALLPRMSRHSADGRGDLVREDLSHGMRLNLLIMVPAALGLVAIGRPLAYAVYAHGAVSGPQAYGIGNALVAFAVGLIPFSMFQLLLRGFYAGQNSRTPTLVMVGVAALNVVTMYALSAVLSDSSRAVALALAFDVAYTAGAVTLTVLLRRQLHGLDGRRVLRLFVRVSIAGVLATAAAYATVSLIRWPAGSTIAVTAVAVVVAALFGTGVFVLAATRMRVQELTDLLRLVRERVAR
ncbi:MAG: murein biosynthesis integral membrane protein MurJ [Frankiaceae bacterium]